MNPPADLSQFIDALAAGEPTPGGGSAAALAGALGAALTAMVSRLTAGRQRFAAVEEQMQATLAEAETLRQRLIQLVADDAAAYEQVRTAYRLPKESAGQQADRRAAIQAALEAASRTPLETARACVAVLQLAAQVAQLGNPNAVTDAAVGALLAHAGLTGALLNVRANLGSIDDARFVTDCQSDAAHLRQEGDAALAQALAQVDQRLS